TPIKPSQWIEFLSHEPTAVGEHGSRSWTARAANLVLTYTEAKAGDIFSLAAHPDEYAVLQYSESAAIRVAAGDSSAEVAEEAFVVVPPGDSSIEVLRDGVLIRLFSAVADDLRESSLNADSYLTPDE